MAEAAWINADAGVPEYNAQELRRLHSMHLFPGSSDRFGARAGVRPTGQDIISVSGTTWTQHDLTAVVYPGRTTVSGPYVVEKTEESGSLDPADGSNPRIDALDLQIRDNDEDASTFRDVRVVYVPGTPAGTPGEPALTANSLRIGTFLVSGGGVPAPSVRTQAHWTVATGGILPVRDSTERPTTALHEGMSLFRVDTGAVEVRSGTDWSTVASMHGFQLREIVYFTSSGTFTKANFPGLRAVRFRAQAGGGAGGGAVATGATTASTASGGQGGNCAERWVLEASLGTNETVTVGAGGNNVTGGNGGAGGTSSVGAHVSAGGGAGGLASTAGAGTSGISAPASSTVATGDVVHIGSAGGAGFRMGTDVNAAVALSGSGGSSHLGGGGRGRAGSGALGLPGGDGEVYGGGGGGAANGDSQSAQVGGDGAPGIVIAEVYV